MLVFLLLGEHGCMTSRGIKKPGTLTTTTTFTGKFQTNDMLRQGFINYEIIRSVNS